MLPRLAVLAILALIPALIWGPASYTGRTATAKATALGPHCWFICSPLNYGTMTVTLNPDAPFRFWSNEEDPHWESIRPHFGIILPDAPHDQFAYGWSFRQMDFWLMEDHVADFHGLNFAQEDCQALLSRANG